MENLIMDTVNINGEMYPHLDVGLKARVVGIYGVSGCGKTHLLEELKAELGTEHFAYYDGSQKISEMVDGGLTVFKSMRANKQRDVRAQAITRIRQECAASGKIGVVAGHFLLWDTDENKYGESIWTDEDAWTYTHIVYLGFSPERILERRTADNADKRKDFPRPDLSATQILQWQMAEIDALKETCMSTISFATFSENESSRVATLLKDLLHEKKDFHDAAQKLDQAVKLQTKHVDTMVVFDADKTLAAVDTGEMFWETLTENRQQYQESPLRRLFSGMGQTREAFWTAMSLYETACDDALFEQVCKSVAWEVIMYPEMVKLLQRIGTDGLVGAVVVTCGLGRVWEEVLRREGLHEHVKVIGGGRPSDGCVYGEIKTALVARLQEYHKMHVWAIGDGPLDLGMIEKADEAIVVVGEEKSRSRSMENKLLEAIEERGLRAQQLLLPNTVSPRGDPAKLPVIQITDDFLDTIHGYRSVIDDRILHATNTAAARLLMTPTRDARIQGGALRVAHHDIGRYLSIHYLGQMMGLEKYHIPHVTGHITEGFRLRYEQRTLIVALMRAGEPLAYGVNTALPQAAFLHAKRALDVTAEHLKGRYTVILADGVINTGTTVAMFIKHIRKISTRVQIIVVAGVTQANAVEDVLASILNEDRRTGLITLRMSDNKYTGVGGTDTGHRLFNTTFLE